MQEWLYEDTPYTAVPRAQYASHCELVSNKQAIINLQAGASNLNSVYLQSTIWMKIHVSEM
jgi:hypothetical protein